MYIFLKFINIVSCTIKSFSVFQLSNMQQSHMHNITSLTPKSMLRFYLHKPLANKSLKYAFYLHKHYFSMTQLCLLHPHFILFLL